MLTEYSLWLPYGFFYIIFVAFEGKQEMEQVGCGEQRKTELDDWGKLVANQKLWWAGHIAPMNDGRFKKVVRLVYQGFDKG